MYQARSESPQLRRQTFRLHWGNEPLSFLIKIIERDTPDPKPFEVFVHFMGVIQIQVSKLEVRFHDLRRYCDIVAYCIVVMELYRNE